MNKKDNMIKTRINNLNAKINKIEAENKIYKEKVKENSLDIKQIKKREVLSMLRETKINGNYMYSYQEIANELNISYGTVVNIAKTNCLARRTNLTVV